jgi:hypothetical protein
LQHFQRKLGILIPDLYLYDIKIQTNIKQNLIEKFTRKSQIFLKGFFKKFFGLGWTWPNHFGLGRTMNSEEGINKLSTVHFAE